MVVETGTIGQHAFPAPGVAPRALLRQVWQRRFWIGSFSVVIGLVTCYAFVHHPVQYSSTIVVYLSEPKTEDQRTVVPGARTPGLERLRADVRSTATIDQLIRECDLYRHYGIDTLAALHHELATARLMNSIELTQTGENTLAIEVLDFDRNMAARLANTMFIAMRAGFQERAERFHTQQVLMHRELIRYQEAQADKRKAELLALAQQLNAMPGGWPENAPVDMEIGLVEASAKLAEANSQLQAIGQRVELMAMMNKNGSFGELVLVNRGMPDIITRPRLTIALAVAGAMGLALLIASAAVYMWGREGTGFLRWFNGEDLASPAI